MAITTTHVLVEAVGQEIRSLRSLLDFYERELPTYTCQRFLRGVRTVVLILEEFHAERVDFCNRVFGSNVAELDTQLRLFSTIVLEILSNIHANYLPYLDASTKQSEYLILPSIVRAIHVWERDVEVILIPQFEYCYGFIGFREFVQTAIAKLETEKSLSSEIKNRFQELSATPEANPSKWTAFLAYPISEKDSALDLAVLAHELAHLADQATQFYRQLLPLTLDESSFKVVADRDTPLQALLTCTSMVEGWLRELIADLLAVHWIGPAYFFAFSEFLAHAAFKDQPDSEHDAPSIRLRLMLDELRYLKYFDSENPMKPLLKAVETEISDEHVDHEPYALVTHKTIQNAIGKIQTKIRELAAEQSISYDAARYIAEVPTIADRLARGITPAEVYDSASGSFKSSTVAGILNAGWQVYKTERFAQFRSLFDHSVTGPAVLANLNQLIFHGIECSEVIRGWANPT